MTHNSKEWRAVQDAAIDALQHARRGEHPVAGAAAARASARLARADATIARPLTVLDAMQRVQVVAAYRRGAPVVTPPVDAAQLRDAQRAGRALATLFQSRVTRYGNADAASRDATATTVQDARSTRASATAATLGARNWASRPTATRGAPAPRDATRAPTASVNLRDGAFGQRVSAMLTHRVVCHRHVDTACRCGTAHEVIAAAIVRDLSDNAARSAVPTMARAAQLRDDVVKAARDAKSHDVPRLVAALRDLHRCIPRAMFAGAVTRVFAALGKTTRRKLAAAMR